MESVDVGQDAELLFVRPSLDVVVAVAATAVGTAALQLAAPTEVSALVATVELVVRVEAASETGCPSFAVAIDLAVAASPDAIVAAGDLDPLRYLVVAAAVGKVVLDDLVEARMIPDLE